MKIYGNLFKAIIGKSSRGQVDELLDLRDEFAIRILIGLMSRNKEDGYTDESAIVEAYKLAEQMVEHKNGVIAKK